MIDITDLIKAIKESKPKTSAYDSEAIVRRIEGNTAWVHIPGGQDETPVRMTINAQPGDNVQVRVSGGSAFIVGNASAPPTDDTKAKHVEQKMSVVEKVVEVVKDVAESASKIASNTRQYFWFTPETGAHITEKPQDEFLADPENGGGNLLATSNGIAVRNGTTELATFSGTEITVGADSDVSDIYMLNGKIDIRAASIGSTIRSDNEYAEGNPFTYYNYLSIMTNNLWVDPLEQDPDKEASASIDFWAQGISEASRINITADQININGRTPGVFQEVDASNYSDADDVPLNTSLYIGSDTTAGSWDNLPNGSAGHLLTFGAGVDKRRVQFYINRNADSNIYIRNSRTGTWSNWRQITTSAI